MITKSQEEYLKTLYVLKKNEEKIKVTSIANRMNLTKPSVNKAMKALKSEGMIEYEPYGDIVLTNEGEEIAKKVLEAYDITYVFLTEILEMSKEEANAQAIRIKSVLSDDTLNKLTKYVYNTLGLYELNCDYDINQEKCRSCARKNLKNRKDMQDE